MVQNSTTYKKGFTLLELVIGLALFFGSLMVLMVVSQMLYRAYREIHLQNKELEDVVSLFRSFDTCLTGRSWIESYAQDGVPSWTVRDDVVGSLCVFSYVSDSKKVVVCILTECSNIYRSSLNLYMDGDMYRVVFIGSNGNTYEKYFSKGNYDET